MTKRLEGPKRDLGPVGRFQLWTANRLARHGLRGCIRATPFAIRGILCVVASRLGWGPRIKIES